MRRSAPHRLLTGLVLALWAAAPLAQVAHSRHAHRYCAEHEAFEEDGASSRMNGRVDASSYDGPTLTERGDLATDDAHELCRSFGQIRTSNLPVRSSLSALAVHWAMFVLPARHTHATSPIAPLASAPKSSPPA